MRDAATEAVTDDQAPAHEVDLVRAGRPRGRHRKPRPRRVVFAVGGLALAAGALSLLRLTAGPPEGGVAATDVEPTAAGSPETPDPVPDTEAAATGRAPTARTSPSATTPLSGGNGSTRATRTTQTAHPTAPVVTPAPPTPPRTAVRQHPTTAPTTAEPPATTPRTPTRTPTRTPAAPAPTGTPRPSPPAPDSGPPDLCVPIVNLCVDRSS